MSAQLHADISKVRADPKAEAFARYEHLAADISHFVEGSFINWGFMKWLEPKKYEHWTLKSVRPRPSLRVFGRFAEPNAFVATHVVARANLSGKWDLDWELEKLKCEDIWNAALPGVEPFRASRYEDYITENAVRKLKVQS